MLFLATLTFIYFNVAFPTILMLLLLLPAGNFHHTFLAVFGEK